MKIELPYLDKKYPLEFPDEQLLAVVEPNEFSAPGDAMGILKNALEHPVDKDGNEGKSLKEFLEGGKKLLIIINDATRPTPTEKILTSLVPYIESSGIEKNRICILVATGAHRPATEEEYHQIMGSQYDVFRNCCVCHESKKEEDLVDVGTTRNGTPIVLNKRLFEADRIIATGSVEPHYFAGFTGGRKAFLPGIAAFKTIETNHKQALSPKARSLALEGNPVHEDMMDALPLIKAPVFSFMTVLDKKHGVAAASAGDLQSSFFKCIETARKIFCVSVPARADIVISVAKFPMDIDLYQSQKAIDNGALVLKDGGCLILISACRDGIGDEAYANLLASSNSPEDAIERIRRGYKLGYHKAAKMAEVSARASVMAVSGLSKERLESMFIEKTQSPQDALDKAVLKVKNTGIERPSIIILTDGCVTIPEPERK